MTTCEPLVKEIPFDIFLSLPAQDQIDYLKLFNEQVSPIFEEWRNPHPVKAAYGGRGAGAKSRSVQNLLIQFGEDPSYFNHPIRVLAVREVQKSIKESSWSGLGDTIKRLGYTGWEVQRERIINRKNGSYFIFNGLSDMTEADLKSYNDFDILFAEEGAPISKQSWLSIDATFRKRGSEIWILFNRKLNMDPCYELYCVNPEPEWSIINCKPGPEDNPWWYDSDLPAKWERLKRIDPISFEHEFLGYPQSQGDRAIFTRAQVLAMVSDKRKAEVGEPKGAIEIGCDVARFGKDNTQAYKRHGLKIIDHQERHGFDTIEVAGMLWDMADHDKKIPIRVDSGYNPGVIDMLASFQANVIPVGFGEVAVDEESYPNAATEMFFKFPIDEVYMPPEMLTNTLFEDMTERLFNYDNAGRKKIEPKDGTNVTEEGRSKSNFKGRHGGRSPDEFDALALCFYNQTQDWKLI